MNEKLNIDFECKKDIGNKNKESSHTETRKKEFWLLSIENVVFAILVLTAFIHQGLKYGFSIYTLFGTIGYCIVIIPFALAFNFLKKGTITKRIIGIAYIALSIITILVTFLSIVRK